MRYLDLHTHSLLSCGVDTPSRMRYQAQKLGIGIGLCDGGSGEGAVIKAESTKGLLMELKGSRDRGGYTIVDCTNEKVAKAALTKRGVDLISLPGAGGGWTLDAVAARKAKEMGVAVEVNLYGLIRSYRMQRARTITGIKACLKLKRKYGFEVVVTTGACSRYGLRKGEQVFELLRLLDFTDEEARAAMVDAPSGILEKGGSQILEGVRVRS